ncbi:MAG: sigma-54-dependent transcriptional regulator [Sandaracinaceae bacterium]
MSARVLIVDDDATYVRALSRSLERAGHDVANCLTAQEARDRFEGIEADVVILDYQLPDADGLALLDELRSRRPGAVFMINTAYPNLDLAVEAMRRGAFDYVAKDGALREVLIRVERADGVAHLRRQVAGTANDGQPQDGLVGESKPMRRLRELLSALEGSDDTTAFIVGETGTGKGVIARHVHAQSGRAFEPFVAVDCTTIPATLVESELFGHEKGAFSGASQSKIGRVEAAARGTLFLDEIGELELPMQTKLLRLLEEREFTRVGSTKARNLTARVIAATNRDLERAVAEGRFRADLRYRLEVFVVRVPPLRERGDDIFLLARHFAEERSRGVYGKKDWTFDDPVLAAMTRYPFPGNVRELRNMVEQAVLLAKGERLTLEEFPVLSRFSQGWQPPAGTVDGGGRPTLEAGPAAVGPAAERGMTDPSLSAAPGGDRGSYPPSGGRATPNPPPPSSVVYGGSPGPAVDGDARRPDGRSLRDIRRGFEGEEKARIVAALESTGGNVSQAARHLDMSRYQLIRRIKKYSLG